MSTQATENAPFQLPGLPGLYRKRDLLLRFLPASIFLHSLAVLPWARVLVFVLRLLGMHGSPIHQKDVDHPTVIPIDIDTLDDPSSADKVASGTGDGNGGVGVVADAGADGADETGGDGGGDGEAGPATPPRVRDPNALAGGLNSIVPRNKEVNVSLLLRMDHLREHPIGKEFGPKLAAIPQWKPFLDGTGVDPMRDIDAIWTFGPRFYETSRVTAIIVHNKPDEILTAGLKVMQTNLKGETIDDPEVFAFKATVDKADKVIVQIKGGLIITPPDGQEQALGIARALIKKGRSAKDMVPKGDKDLIAAWFLRKPSNVMTGIPDDLTDTHITIRKRKDDGGILDADAKSKDAKHAVDDADAVRKLVESIVPKGVIGYFVRKYVDGYKVEAVGDVVHLHHELDGDQLNAIWTKLSIGGF